MLPFQFLFYTRCTVLRQSVQRVGTAHVHVIAAWATQLLLKKCRNGGEPLATVCPISLAQDLSLGPSAPNMNALPLNQQKSLFLFQEICHSVQKNVELY